MNRSTGPDSTRLTVNGINLEVAWVGPADSKGPVLVLLHEGLGCVGLWRDFPGQLATRTGLRVLSYSRQGYGGSDPCAVPRPLTYMHDEAIQVLPELLRAAGVQEYVLVGHSDGGSIALIFAGGTSAPGLKGVVTLAAHVFCEQLSVQSIAEARDAFGATDLRHKLMRYHGDNVDCAFWGWNRAWLDPDFLHWNIEEYLPGIEVPLLAIQGRDDQYGTPAQVESIVSRSGGQAQALMLADCRHSPHLDQTEQVIVAIADFCRTIGP